LQCSARVNFVHIPKTGGTTLSQVLRENFHRSQIYPYAKVGNGHAAATTQEEVQSALRRLPEINHDLVWGHFPIWFFENKDPTYDTSYFFTVLRDPIDRALSHARDKARGSKAEINPDKGVSNFLCKMLCSDCTLEGEALIEDCMKNLERMNFIIFMDDYENGVKRLFQELGLRVPENIPHYNSTERSPVRGEIIDKIRERNSLDIELYRRAVARFRGLDE